MIQLTPDAPLKRNWQPITIVLIVILGTFVGKQAVDASTRWDNEATMIDAKIQVSSAVVPSYNLALHSLAHPPRVTTSGVNFKSPYGTPPDDK